MNSGARAPLAPTLFHWQRRGFLDKQLIPGLAQETDQRGLEHLLTPDSKGAIENSETQVQSTWGATWRDSRYLNGLF